MSDNLKLTNFYVILVEPVYKGNIGSVSRVMNNFCFPNLRIVGTIPTKDDYVIGAHSHQIISNYQSYHTLAEAIDDLDRIIIFSRRTGSKKKPDYNPRQIGNYLSKIGEQIRIGLVFGRETFGLTDAECQLADLRCYIQANATFPSLNLAQAVAIVLYEIYHQNALFLDSENENKDILPVNKTQNVITSCAIAHKKPKFDEPAQKNQIKDSIGYAIGVLDKIKAFKSEKDQQYFRNYLNSLLIKANCTEQMSIDLKRIFNRVLVAFFGKGQGFQK